MAFSDKTGYHYTVADSIDREANMVTPPEHQDITARPERRIDPMVAAYMKDVDVTLLRENLKLTVTERFEKFEKFYEYAMELREAGRKARAKKTMTKMENCPHCGYALSSVHDAFCPDCHEALDEPPMPRSTSGPQPFQRTFQFGIALVVLIVVWQIVYWSLWAFGVFDQR